MEGPESRELLISGLQACWWVHKGASRRSGAAGGKQAKTMTQPLPHMHINTQLFHACILTHKHWHSHTWRTGGQGCEGQRESDSEWCLRICAAEPHACHVRACVLASFCLSYLGLKLKFSVHLYLCVLNMRHDKITNLYAS